MFGLTKRSIGIDIADRTIEVVELEKSGLRVKIKNLSRVSLSPGIVEKGQIKDEKLLSEAIHGAL